jgi:hypothetical protein
MCTESHKWTVGRSTATMRPEMAASYLFARLKPKSSQLRCCRSNVPQALCMHATRNDKHFQVRHAEAPEAGATHSSAQQKEALQHCKRRQAANEMIVDG